MNDGSMPDRDIPGRPAGVSDNRETVDVSVFSPKEVNRMADSVGSIRSKILRKAVLQVRDWNNNAEASNSANPPR